MTRRSFKTMSAAGRELTKIRRNRNEAARAWTLHQLRKDGKLSGMHDAARTFATEEEARTSAARMQALNPTRNLRFALIHDGDRVGTL